MRFALETTRVLVLLALVACGDDAMVTMPPVTQQPPAAGGSGSAGGPATSGQGMSAAGRAGSSVSTPAAGSGGRSGAAGTSLTAGSAAGAGAGAAGSSSGTAGIPAAGSSGTAGASGAAGQDGEAGAAGAAGMPATALGENDTLVPHASWDCGMPAGIPGPTAGELAFEATFQLGEVYDIGKTQFGNRLLIEVKGGSVKGPEIEATVMDRGLDWQLTLPNGAIEVEQVTILRASDGANIYFRNCGASASEAGDVRIVPDFEAPNSSRHAWLNTTKLAGTRTFDRAAKTMNLKVYKYAETSTGMAGTMVKVEQPAGLPDQTWECKEPTGRRGEVMYTESVGIGGSVSVGASKRGSRNIIPITGGSASGRLAGGVLSGGADFQLSAGGEFILDARYTLKTNDNQLIIVRNCGPIGALVPVFEASATGPYAWVNEGNWLSSDPSIAIGAVNLTIYEAN